MLTVAVIGRYGVKVLCFTGVGGKNGYCCGLHRCLVLSCVDVIIAVTVKVTSGSNLTLEYIRKELNVECFVLLCGRCPTSATLLAWLVGKIMYDSLLWSVGGSWRGSIS